MGRGQRENAERCFWQAGKRQGEAAVQKPLLAAQQPYPTCNTPLPSPSPPHRGKSPGGEDRMETLGGDNQTQNLIHHLTAPPGFPDSPSPHHTRQPGGGAVWEPRPQTVRLGSCVGPGEGGRSTPFCRAEH